MSTPDAETLLREAHQLPHGRPRSALLERAIAAADLERHEPAAVHARLELVQSYNYGGETTKMFTPFSELLTRFDEAPATFDEQQVHSLLWQFKWMTVVAARYPDVPRARIESMLDEMEARYRARGEGLGPVLRCRATVQLYLDGPDAAAAAFEEARRAARTSLSDCAACTPTDDATHLARAGAHEAAVDATRDVVLGRETCAEQPQSAIAAALLSTAETGDLDLARQLHVRGWRLVRSNPHEVGLAAAHLLLCARTGNEARAGELLQHVARLLPTVDVPERVLDLTTGAAVAAHAMTNVGLGDSVVTVDGAQTPVATMADTWTAAARALAARFDERNGNDVVTRRIEETLAAPALPHLDLRAYAPSAPDGSAPPTPAGVAAPPAAEAPAPEALDLHGVPASEVLERVTSARARGSFDEMDRLAAAWTVEATHRPTPDDPDEHGAFARLRRFLTLLSPDASTALDASIGAIEELRAAAGRGAEGAEAEAALVTFEAASIAHDAGMTDGRLPDVDTALAALRALGPSPQLAIACKQQAGHSAPDVRMALLEEALAAVPSPASTRARRVRAATLVDLAGAVADAGDLERATALLDDAEALLTEEDALDRVTLGRTRAGLDEAAGRLEQALDGLLAVIGSPAALPGTVAEARWMAAGIAGLDLGQPERGVELLRPAIPELDRLPDPTPARVRGLLTQLLGAAGRHHEAAEAAEASIASLAAPTMQEYDLFTLAARANHAAGDLDRARALLERAADLGAQEEVWRAAVAALAEAAEVVERTEQPEAAVALWQRCLDAARRSSHAGDLLLALSSLALQEAQHGDGAVAARLLDEAAEVLATGEQELGDAAAWERARLAMRRGEVALVTGRDDEAIAELDGVPATFVSLGDGYSAAAAARAASIAMHRSGAADDAERLLRTMLDALEQATPQHAPMVARLLVELLDARGEREAADALHARWFGEQPGWG